MTKEMCADFLVTAETPKAAEKKALTFDRVMYSDEWCDGHFGLAKAHVVEELTEEE